MKQDEDVLDTWFSSALWPFSTLGWPEKTDALKTFYPTSILETGFDIIFFWVARMIMMGLHFMKEVPFEKIYLHAMVRDEKGEKMSKSKGNVINPLDIVEKHGADPLRFTLAIMAGQGRDIKLSTDRVEGYRAFCNKLWNATKFYLLQLEPAQGGPVELPKGGVKKWLVDHQAELSVQNKWILSRLQTVIETVEKGLENFELNTSAQALYDFTWHEFCDWYIELSKLPLREGGKQRTETLYTLRFVLGRLLRLMHPFMPFVTEELWQALPWIKPAKTPLRETEGAPEIRTIMLQSFPKVISAFQDPDAENTIAAIKGLVDAIRNFRGENSIPSKVEFPIQYYPGASVAEAFIRMYAPQIQFLAKVKEFQRIHRKDIKDTNGAPPTEAGEALIPILNPPLELRVSLKGLVNVDEEAKRLQKEIDKLFEELAFVRNKLGQDSFISKAPPVLVEKERKREKDLVTKTAELKASLERLQGMK